MKKRTFLRENGDQMYVRFVKDGYAYLNIRWVKEANPTGYTDWFRNVLPIQEFESDAYLNASGWVEQ
jgi:hypothetical protein